MVKIEAIVKPFRLAEIQEALVKIGIQGMTETPEMFTALDGKRFKAFRGIPESVNGFARSESPAFLVDASVKGLHGGSGVTADWEGAADLAKKYPLLLAGGLTPENVAEAVSRVKQWGVDVASGVESAPGEKDARKMKAFVQAVKQTMNHGR